MKIKLSEETAPERTLYGKPVPIGKDGTAVPIRTIQRPPKFRRLHRDHRAIHEAGKKQANRIMETYRQQADTDADITHKSEGLTIFEITYRSADAPALVPAFKSRSVSDNIFRKRFISELRRLSSDSDLDPFIILDLASELLKDKGSQLLPITPAHRLYKLRPDTFLAEFICKKNYDESVEVIHISKKSSLNRLTKERHRKEGSIASLILKATNDHGDIDSESHSTKKSPLTSPKFLVDVAFVLVIDKNR